MSVGEDDRISGNENGLGLQYAACINKNLPKSQVKLQLVRLASECLGA